MEPDRAVKGRAQAGAWDPAVQIAVEAAVMARVRAETVFVQTVGKEYLIN